MGERVAAMRAGGDAARVARLAATVLLAVVPCGCMAVVAGAAGGAAVGMAAGDAAVRHDSTRYGGASVAVAFAPARDVALVGAARGDTSWVRSAVSVLGRVTETRGDTLRLAVSEGRGTDGAATFPGGREPVTEVVPGPGVAVRVISRAPTQTDAAFTGAFLGTVLAFVAALVAVTLMCSQSSCGG